MTLVASAVALGADSNDRGAFDRDSGSARGVLEDARERERRRRAHRDSEAGRDERRRSRTAYRDQSGSEAHRTARTQFPELIGPWPARWPALGEKDELDRYLSDNAAVVETAAGRRAIVESIVPLRGKQPDGDRAPVDLALTELDDALAPKSSATEVRLPKHAGGALRFPDSSFGVRLAGTRDSDATLTYGKAFYANALEDTDLVLEAAPLGAEVSLVLRSPASPTRPTLDFDLAPGQRLRPVSKGGVETGEVEIVADDDRVALVGPALAVDAQGEGVEVRYAVHGSRLVLSVDTSGEVAYPVAVDPVIYEKNEYGQPLPPSEGASWHGWTYEATNNRGTCVTEHTARAFFACPFADAAIRIYAYGGQYYETNDYAVWRNYARPGAYLFRFDTSNLSHYESWPYTLAFSGIVCGTNACSWMSGTWAAPDGSWGDEWAAYGWEQTILGQTRYFCVDGMAPPVGHCTGQGPEDNPVALGDSAMFGIGFQNAGHAQDYSNMAVGGAAVYETDNSPPRVSGVSHSTPVPTGWVYSYSDTATVTAVDNGTTGLGPNLAGMGVDSVTVAGGGMSQSRSQGMCFLSNNYTGCPTNWTAPGIPYTAPEGRTTYTASARDIIQNQSPSPDNVSWVTKVDRTPPTISATGSIVDASAVTDVPYILDVDVSDGSGTGAGAGSGVQSVTVRLDGEVLRTVTPDCTNMPDNCKPAPFQVKLDGSDMPEGEREIVVAATDRVGNSTSKRVAFHVKHAATAAVGPGEVNLLNGTFTTSATDASFPSFSSSLALSRTYSSRNPDTKVDPMFGPGWLSSLPVPEAAAEYEGIVESPNQAVAVLKFSEGLRIGFKLSTGTYRAPVGFRHLKLTKPSSTTFRLADTDGNAVTFTKLNPVAAARFVPTQVDQPGASGTNRSVVSYEVIPGVTTRPTRILAPVPSGVSCAGGLVAGCRALSFVYATSTTASGASLGDFKDRLKEVNLTVFDPDTSQMRTTAVARYLYGTSGRLRAAWDPRITPALTTSYSYDAFGNLTSITPPGQETWTLAYATTANDPTNPGRLSSASRPALPGTATTKVAYGVPLTGSGAPYQMGASNVAAWGQSQAPAAATAIFPPNHVPSNPPSDYSPADVHYLDLKGRQVNLAEPGGRISTTEHDVDDNVSRELTPANRQRALASGNSAQRAGELDTDRSFGADGLEMTDEYGPLHTVELASGETVQARRHVHITYDEGRTGGAEHLPTTTTVSAQIAGRPDADARTTKHTYDWGLGKPLTETKDPGGLNLTETTRYDGATGLVTETRQPSEPGGGGAGTTKTIYWSAGGNASDPACGGRPEWANLPCKTTPAAQPAGGPPVPVTEYTYNWLGQVVTQTDRSGTTSRTQAFGYDGAGRELSVAISSGAGAPQPTVFTAYHPALGLPTTTSTSDGTISRGYDSLGRVTSYTDSDASASTTTYDVLGRPATTTDGKGSQTRTYDAITGDLTAMSISGVGSLSASYDADGKLTREAYPNGVSAETTYDETGDPVRLVYSKTSNCGTDCNWYSDAVTSSIHDQWLSETSTLGDKDYAYDGAGRLTQVGDTRVGRCTVRDYSYDANSNRTTRVSHDPALNGSCQPSSTGARSDYHYDPADRLDSSGYTYDAFGRTLTVPGRDTGVAGAGGATDMNQTYFADDRVQSISQDLVKTTYTLDPNRRVRTENLAGVEPINRTNHYSDDSDSPTWSSEDSLNVRWSRNVAGIDGDLIAIQDSVTGVQFQFTNLRGDLIATAAADSSAPELLKTSQYDEFGVPAATNTPDRYGWLGSKQRATSQPSGAMLMGQRVYLPTTGRFLQTDPVDGGSANAYDYANADPVNSQDLDGRQAVRCRAWSRVPQRRRIFGPFYRARGRAQAECLTSGNPRGSPIERVRVDACLTRWSHRHHTYLPAVCGSTYLLRYNSRYQVKLSHRCRLRRPLRRWAVISNITVYYENGTVSESPNHIRTRWLHC